MIRAIDDRFAPHSEQALRHQHTRDSMAVEHLLCTISLVLHCGRHRSDEQEQKAFRDTRVLAVLQGVSVGPPHPTKRATPSTLLRAPLLAPPSATPTQTVQQASPAPVYLQDSKTLGFLEAAKQLGIKNKLRPAEFSGLRGMCLPMESLDKPAEGE
eukprot:scaffold222932_cov21-Tisochrysis_lutea.AAC.1